jgi:DNA primase
LVLLFDGDAAGETAAWRALMATLPLHPDLGVVVLPPGKDPDDLVREDGAAELRARIAAPHSPVAFALDALRRQGLDGHLLLGRVAELLASVGSGIAREMMLDEAAERSRMPVQVLRREVERLRQAPARYQRGRPGPERVDRPASVRLTALEEAMLRLVQTRPSSAQKLCDAARGVPAISGSVTAVLTWVADRVRNGSDPQTPELLRRLCSEVGEEVEAGFLLDEDAPPPDERFRDDLLRRLRGQALEAEMVGLGYEIRMLEGAGDAEGRLPELLRRKQELARDLARLRETGKEPGG